MQLGSSGGVVEYRTFPDTFVKVLAYPSKVPENPAETLKVCTRSGLILEYGGAADAVMMGRNGVIRSWLVQRASDRSENTISYEYWNRTGDDGSTSESLPLRIRYTGNRSVLPSRMVEFAYEPREASDVRTLFAGGAPCTTSQRLAKVSMLGPERSLVREYRFAYKTGLGTGRTLLRNIKECAADNTCKPRTTFDWYGGRPRVRAHPHANRGPAIAARRADDARPPDRRPQPLNRCPPEQLPKSRSPNRRAFLSEPPPR